MTRRKNQSCSELKNYNTQLRRRRTLFPCPRPHCDQVLLSKNFQNHCSRVHHFNPLLGCVWCWGDRSWASGHKHRQVDHMTCCWRNFLARHAPPVPREPAPLLSDSFRPDPVLSDLTPLCPPQDLFDHEPMDLERLYNPIWPVALSPNALTFADHGLNLAASCVRLYIELKDTMDFFHAMVRVVAFPSFLRAMDADQGRSRTLPFSTLCNGGHWPEARHRQHRHLIVVSPKGHFLRHVWRKIRIPAEDRPRAHYQCLKKFPILSPSHFINALGYLSQRESYCDFSKDESVEDADALRVQTTSLSHFWVSTTLPRDFRLPLFTQYNNGILDLLAQTYPNFSLDDMLRFPLVFLDGKWKLKIKELPDLLQGTVLPVSRDLRPCSYPTPAYVYLMQGRKMYFERDAHPDTWLENQVEHGNLFYHTVSEEYFTLRPYHQLLLNTTKPIHIRNQELVAENNQLRQHQHNTQREINHLKRQVNYLNIKVERSKRNTETWLRHREDHTAKWRRKNAQLKKKLDRISLKRHSQNK